MVSYLVSFCIKCMLSAWGNAFPFSFFVITKNSFNLLKHFWVVDMAWYGIKTLLLHSKPSSALYLPSDNISNKKLNSSGMKGILALLGPVWLCIMKICKNKWERKKYNQIASAGFSSKKKPCVCVFWTSFIYTMIWDLTAGIPVPVRSSFDFSITQPRDLGIEDYPHFEDGTLGPLARPRFEVLWTRVTDRTRA